MIFNRTLPRDLTEALDGFIRDDQDDLASIRGVFSDQELKEWRLWAQKAHDQSSVIEKTLDGLEKSTPTDRSNRIPWIRIEEQKQNLGDLASTLNLALTFERELKGILSI